MGSIFISYNRQSEEITKTLSQDLEELGYTVWFDHEISGGQVWWDQILSKIRECSVFVFVTDLKSLDSTACKREIAYAASLGKTILPVLVSADVSVNLLPPELSKIQFVDYRTYDTKAVLRLARAVAAVPPSKPLPDPLPEPPEIPVSYLGGLTGKIESKDTLNYADQSQLLVEIKQSFKDPSTAKDARTLMERLRKRPDLFAAIADEIDELLEKSKRTMPDKDLKNSPERPDPRRVMDEQPDTYLRHKDELKDQPITLGQIVPGTWSVRITQFLGITLHASFIFSSNGSFSGTIFSDMGNIPVQGQWAVQAQALSLNGFQTLAFMNYPYSAYINFTVITKNRLEGNSQAGEQIVMEK